MIEFTSLENLEKFFNTHPDSIVFAHLALRLMEEGNLERAQEICQEGLEKHPTFIFGHYVLALLKYRQKNFSEAKREFEFVLAHDPANPRAWNLLTEINESMNLAVMTQDSNLNYFLSDCFNSRAAEKYFTEDVVSMITPKDEILKDEFGESGTGEEIEKQVEEMSDAEIDNLFETVSPPEEETNDFEKALDEVFKDTFEEVEEDKTEEDISSLLTEAKPLETEPGESAEASAEEELGEAMDSFFEEHEAGEDEKDFQVQVKEEITEDSESETPPNPETEFPTDFIEETSEEEAAEKVVPEEFDNEEPIDFSSVVADIISERKEAPERIDFTEEPVEQPQITEQKEEEEIKPGIEKAPETPHEPEPAAKIEIQEETQQPRVEEKSVPPGGPVATEEIEEKPSGKTDTTHFGRPPILSPTLGEIYIAQGRFEEAMDVFRQLLDKDPENARYQRKLEDLENIIEKQKSQAGNKSE
ncbi:hypothetical protein B1H10_00730 [candidate division KSB1 bacterium 4484_188]|nr:MAG: hypothetical protein B1H10_00730 [candidate division KSB1 bacterium 4484_188]